MLKRRKFVKGMTALGIVTSMSPLVACGGGSSSEDEEPQDPGYVFTPVTEPQTVYRLQVTKKNTCKACKQHHRYKVFSTDSVADLNRAHNGCNCRITTQVVSADYFNGIGPYMATGVAELRTIFGY